MLLQGLLVRGARSPVCPLTTRGKSLRDHFLSVTEQEDSPTETIYQAWRLERRTRDWESAGTIKTIWPPAQQRHLPARMDIARGKVQSS